MSDLRLIGFRDSVYTRAARLALEEAGTPYALEDVDPFTEDGQNALHGRHPFGRVPVLEHAGFVLYETGAILEYVCGALGGEDLVPPDAKARARMRQVIAIVDAYAYWPLVRQVFAQAVYRPLMGEETDAATVATGLSTAVGVLDTLEDVAREGRVLTGRTISQADIMLLPMIDAFVMYPPAAEMMGRRAALNAWYRHVRSRPASLVTRPAFMAETPSG